jgi:regulatory protein
MQEKQPDAKTEIKPSKIRLSAMGILAGREYLRSQLQAKLEKKFDNSSLIPDVLDQLAAENLQSDHRFVEAFIRARISRGQGSTRIRLDLKSRGAETGLIEQLLNEADVDWFKLAKDTAQLKFGSDHRVDAKEKAKRMRFLQYRGFSFDQINYALNN